MKAKNGLDNGKKGVGSVEVAPYFLFSMPGKAVLAANISTDVDQGQVTRFAYSRTQEDRTPISACWNLSIFYNVTLTSLFQFLSSEITYYVIPSNEGMKLERMNEVRVVFYKGDGLNRV